MRAEIQKQPCQGMCSTEESRPEAMENVINNEALRLRLKQSQYRRCSVRKRSSKDALFWAVQVPVSCKQEHCCSAEALERNRKEFKVVQQRQLQKRRGF